MKKHPVDAFPDTPGAYLLVIEIEVATTVRLGRRPEAVLPPGRYAYCGSARGPGGLAARVRRHLRSEKRRHWHVDQLTEVGRIVDLRLLPGGSECDLLRHLLDLPGVRVAIPGFGSSDCRRCPAHLVSLPAGLEIETPLVPTRPD